MSRGDYFKVFERKLSREDDNSEDDEALTAYI